MEDTSTSAGHKRAISASRFEGSPCPAHFNITRDIISEAAATCPDKIALMVVTGPNETDPIERFTYAELEAAIQALASHLLKSGVTRGDRVMIRMRNTPTYAFTVFACFAIGAIALPVSDQLTDRELHILATDAKPSTVVFSASVMSSALQSAPHLIDAEEFRSLSTKSNLDFDYANTSPNDPALLIYTSGTTARPKGVLHGHQMAWGRRPMAEGWYGLTPNDRLMHAGAFNWTFTLGTGLIDPWMAGATAIINTGPRDPDIWPKLLKRTDATLFAAVPGLIRQILKYAGSAVTDLPSIRHAMIAGDTPPNGLFEDWQKATGTPLYEALGMSEISTYISCGPNVPRRPGAIGRPQAGRAVAILPETDPSTKPLPTGEIGLLAVHRTDPGLMLGYWNRNDEEREVFRGEWFIGGDLAEMDHDGYIIHHGRDNDVMKPLGYRIAPQEIEDVLVAHSGVAEAACTEVEIKNGVRVIAAFIVPEHPTSPPSEADLLKHASANLAAYKCPRIIHIVDTLPRTANGKLTRSRLATRVNT